MSDVLVNVVKALDLSEWLKIVERRAHNTSCVGQMVAVDRLHNCIDLVRILRIQAEESVHLVFSRYWELLTIDGSPISSQGPVRDLQLDADLFDGRLCDHGRLAIGNDMSCGQDKLVVRQFVLDDCADGTFMG
jgi:hypothetical protein